MNNNKFPFIKRETLLKVVGVVFTLVALLHLARVAMGFPMIIAGWLVPIWINWLGFIAAGYLGLASFTLARRTGEN